MGFSIRGALQVVRILISSQDKQQQKMGAINCIHKPVSESPLYSLNVN